MAYDFPASPIENQEYTPAGGVTYIFKAPQWLVKTVPLTAGEGPIEAPLDGKQYGRQDAGWTQVLPNPTWSTLSGKPATFPPDAHVHAYSSLTGIPTTFPPESHTHAYSTLTGIPVTFAPSAHGHPQSEITNLVTDLAGKAPTVHTHAQSEITGLVTALSGKEPTIAGSTTDKFWRGDKTWVAIPGADWSTLSGKPSTFPPSPHNHAISEVTSLQTTLDGKAAAVHTHAQADITNLVTDQATQDTNILAKVPKAGGTMTGKLNIASSVQAGAMFNIPPGMSPDTPTNGDIWLVGGSYNFYGMANGVTSTFVMSSSAQTITGIKTFSTKPIMATPAAGGASINLPHGAAPTAPVNGDMWTTTGGLYARINAATKGPFIDATALTGKADIDSPVFTGNPQAPTPAPGDNDLSVATTGFVTAAVTAGVDNASYVPLAGGTMTGSLTLSSTTPLLRFFETDAASPLGQFALTATGGGSFQFNRYDGANFTTPVTIWRYGGASGTLLFDVPISSTLQIASVTPQLQINETDQTDPAGMYRFYGTGGWFYFQKAASAAWATQTSVWWYDPSLDTMNFKDVVGGTATFSGVIEGILHHKQDGGYVTIGAYNATSYGTGYGRFFWDQNNKQFRWSAGDGSSASMLIGSITTNSNVGLAVEGTLPQLLISEVDQTDPAGRFRFYGTGGLFYFQRALTPAWATADTIYVYNPTIGKFTINPDVVMGGAVPILEFDESGLASPKGHYRFWLSGGTFSFQNALTANFATYENILQFKSKGDGGTGTLNIFPGISVGGVIGTSTASLKLDASYPSIWFHDSTPSGSYPDLMISAGNSSFRFMTTDVEGANGVDAFSINPAGSMVTSYLPMTIDVTGIAGTSVYPLTARAATGVTAYIARILDGAGGEVLGLYSSTGNNIVLRNRNGTATTVSYLQLNAAGTAYLSGPSGVQLIGNLDCRSSSDAQAFATNGGAAVIPGTVSAFTTATAANCYLNPTSGTVYRSTSARKYKERIEPLEYSLDVAEVIDALKPITFYPKDLPKDRNIEYIQHIGIVADDVVAVAPQLVSFNDAGEVEGFQYERLTVVLLAEVQTLRKRVAELEAA